MITSSPELSIIVPILNDAIELSGLLADLTQQNGVNFEVILCDGGSTDGIKELFAAWTSNGSFMLRRIETSRGRGLQMNAGAVAAISDTLLFLHADSRFPHNDALRSGINAYENHKNHTSNLSAARFRLSFCRSVSSPSLSYYYHEAKARLNRGDCVRGDQGYLINRTTFDQLGRFDCLLPFLEDVRLATLLAKKSEWLLLPAEISTSARRFEQEGFYERQVANAIIINAIETGWNELLTSLPELYRCTSSKGRLLLFPLLDGVRTLITSHNSAWQTAFWRGTGRHVATNAWQFFFWLDVRSAFRAGQEPDHVLSAWLSRYERRLKPMFESRPATWLAEIFTRIWFWQMLRVTRKGGDITKTN